MRKSALFLLGLVVTALVALGLVVLSSASEANALRIYGSPHFFMVRQCEFLGAGVFVAAVAALFDYHRWRDQWVLAALFYFTVFALLWAVFLFPEVKGAHRWIVVGPLRLQPGEFAKLAVVIALGVWLDKAAWRVELFGRGAFWPSAIIGVIALPVLLEPDFGSVVVIGAAGVMLMFVAGTRVLHLLPFIVSGLVIVGVKLAFNKNRIRRLAGYFGSHSADAVSSGAAAVTEMDPAAYQAYQSRVAIQNGNFLGVGFGESMQKHLYLPEAHTDFIFAVGAEELGLGFTVAVIVLFAAFFALSVYIARMATDRLGRFLVLGMAFLVFFQAMVNLGVVCEALPTKGMALPFFSYGGTNLLSTFFAVGTILSVGIHASGDKKKHLAHRVWMGKGRDC